MVIPLAQSLGTLQSLRNFGISVAAPHSVNGLPMSENGGIAHDPCRRETVVSLSEKAMVKSLPRAAGSINVRGQ
jgi:hypothetical protein